MVGYAEDGDGVSLRIQCADVRKVLGSVHKIHAEQGGEQEDEDQL